MDKNKTLKEPKLYNDDYTKRILSITGNITVMSDIVALHLGEFIDGIIEEDEELVTKKYKDIKDLVRNLQSKINELEKELNSLKLEEE